MWSSAFVNLVLERSDRGNGRFFALVRLLDCVAPHNHAFDVMSFLHGSDFATLAHLSVRRHDTLTDVFFSRPARAGAHLCVEPAFSWGATPSTGIPRELHRS